LTEKKADNILLNLDQIRRKNDKACEQFTHRNGTSPMRRVTDRV